MNCRHSHGKAIGSAAADDGIPDGERMTRRGGRIVDLDDVREAARRLEGVVHRTPAVTSRTLDERTGATVHLKAENLQRTGSFKIRGAFNRIAAMTGSERGDGVVAYSSGNHGQAVALAAALHDIPAVIVMPADAPPVKLAATRGYGAEVVTYERATESREEIGETIATERGLTLVRPFDDPLVIAGQGTVGLEFVEDVGPLDLLVVPIGGGGLMAGSATAVSGVHPDVRIIGVEPELADDTRRSLEAGERVRHVPGPTRADGLLASTPGELTFEVNRKLVERVVTVTEEEIVAAMVFTLERIKLLIEPSGAVGLAAVLTGRIPDLDGHRVGVVLSGGNIGTQQLSELLLRE
jgi:threo-3-hydroxy-L-aspartate ammonia-lyase